jgi:predicted nucleic acid-binding protein
MRAERYTFDTNILFYALDPDAGDKHRTASRLIATADNENAIIVLQSLGELCTSVRRKRPALASAADRFALGNAVLFDVAHALPSDPEEAILANQQHNIPFWDAMLWATARRAGCTLLLTEDFHDGQILGGVTVRNPFLMSRIELATLLK